MKYSAPISFASLVSLESSTLVATFRTFDSGTTTMTVLKCVFLYFSVLEANPKYENSLYGYFLGKRIVFPVF